MEIVSVLAGTFYEDINTKRKNIDIVVRCQA